MDCAQAAGCGGRNQDRAITNRPSAYAQEGDVGLGVEAPDWRQFPARKEERDARDGGNDGAEREAATQRDEAL
jgi:hypothetical protein